jgi:hypothetical protein
VFTWVLCTVVIVTALTWGVSTIRSGFSAALPTRTAGNGESMAVVVLQKRRAARGRFPPPGMSS